MYIYNCHVHNKLKRKGIKKKQNSPCFCWGTGLFVVLFRTEILQRDQWGLTGWEVKSALAEFTALSDIRLINGDP